MNDSTKLWKWMVALLAILNLTLLIALFNGRHHMEKHAMHMPPEGMHHPPGKPSEFLIHELQLTPEQIKQFDALKDQHSETIRHLMEEGHDLRDNFFDLLKQDSIDTKSVEEKAALIATNQQKIETATFEHFKKVRQICTPGQKQKFDHIINEVLKQMARPHGGPGGPPPPHHP